MKTIFKSCKDTHFVKIANSMLRDKRLSMGARGLLAMILTHSEEWVVTKSWLIDQGPDGYDAITSMLKELSSLGYAVNEKQGRDGSGTFTKSVWMFSDEGFTARGNPCTVSRARSTGSRQTHTKKEQSSEENGTEENGEDLVGNGFPTPQLPQERPVPSLEANPEAEPKGQGEETPHVPRPPLTAPDKYADARKVLAHLNASTGRNFRETDSNLKLIHGRLLEAGVDVGGCLQMIDRQCAKWLKDPKMAEYLRPETLFGKLKFDSYYSARSLPVVLEAPKVHGQKHPTRWDLEKEQARLEEALKKHKGNDNSMVYVHEWATPEQIEDANRLKARLKDVKAKLLHFQSGE
jgi:uncharacterized phage protein (TIGR02220 family)